MSAMIEAHGLRKQYRNTEALRGIDFSIEPGRIVGLIGPNGAGKTTALKAILGLTDFQGQLNVLGHDPRIGREHMMQEVSFIADVAVLPRWIRVHQVVDFVAGVHPKFDRARHRSRTCPCRGVSRPVAHRPVPDKPWKRSTD